jgi:hypothetical protein
MVLCLVPKRSELRLGEGAVASFAGVDFRRALRATWLGRNSPSDDLKRAFLCG